MVGAAFDLVLVGVVCALEVLIPPSLDEIGVSTALARSWRQHKRLIVVNMRRPPAGRASALVGNDKLEAWIKRHAIFIESEMMDPESKG